jgi:nitrogen fixation/metabolism regulation signal transduction histidine kinase
MSFIKEFHKLGHHSSKPRVFFLTYYPRVFLMTLTKPKISRDGKSHPDDLRLSSENTTFHFLRNSSQFLDAILQNMSSCVLLLDHEMKVQAFNDALKTIFSKDSEEPLLYKKCGDAIGCAYAVDEMKQCGSTTHCCNCSLRKSALDSYVRGIPTYKKKLAREFYRTDGRKELKQLRFSTRVLDGNEGRYVFVLVDDLAVKE